MQYKISMSDGTVTVGYGGKQSQINVDVTVDLALQDMLSRPTKVDMLALAFAYRTELARHRETMDVLARLSVNDILIEYLGDGKSVVDAKRAARKLLSPDETSRNVNYIDSSQFRVDTFSVRQRGGFSTEVDTGVRITHVPTGISVERSEDRSVHRNKAVAFESLKDILEKMGVAK